MKITYYPRYFIRRFSVKGKDSFYSAGYRCLYPECTRHGMTPWQHYVIDGFRKGYDDGNHPSGDVFFPEGYLLEYPDVTTSGEGAWHHYSENGSAGGRDNGLHPGADQFFPEGYLEMYPDAAASGMDPWHHYVLVGKKEGLDSGLHPAEDMFFADGYLELYQDVAMSGLDPWHHYVLTGKKVGRDNGLHPGDDMFFAEGYAAMYPDIAETGKDSWHHYVLTGKKEGRDSGLHPKEDVFFPEGYIEMYPDIADAGIDPWRHYVLHGKNEGRDSGLHPKQDMFFPEGYLEMYPDIAEAGINPWRHYVLAGKKEGRDNGLHPAENMFFAEGYLELYHDVAEAGLDPWHHYVLMGKREGRDSGLHPRDDVFFAEGYAAMYPDIAEAGVDPWRHYVLAGKKEGRDNGLHPSKNVFSAEGYLLNYSNVMKAGVSPWLHYMLCGRTEWQKNWLEDYSVRLAGHEQEMVRSVYLTRSSADWNIKKHHHRVLLIGHEFSVSGAPLSLLGIAKILISEGYSVDIAVKDINQIRNISLYDGLGADVFLIPNSADCFPNANQIVRNYDFVIINTVVMGSYATLCRKLNIPHIWFIREDLSVIRLFFNEIKTTRQDFFGDTENILCVSKYVADSIFNEYKIYCRHINNFIFDHVSSDKQDQSQKNPQSAIGRIKTFAVVGSVESRKSQQSAAAAFMYVSSKSRYKDRWKLFFIGKYGRDCNDPTLGIKLQSATKDLPDIVWSGEVTENKWELFRSIDFFIVPSLEESSSRVAIEATMLGKPVICTTHVGAKYLTENGSGFLFKPGNTAELRDIIEKCIDMPEDEYRRMSRQARLNYEKTSTPAVYHKALSSVIKETMERFNEESAPSDSSENSAVSLRSMSTGKNVFSVEVPKAVRFEYVSFADFVGSAGSPPSDSLPEITTKTGIVVPVVSGSQHLKALVKSLFRNTDLPHMFVFVDDCQAADNAEFLKGAVRGRDDCILIRNKNNLGPVRSSNIGAEKALESCSSFVLLDENTEVPSGWLGRMLQPLLENEKVSSVIPFSNCCDALSFPFSEKRERNEKFLSEFRLDGINSAMRKSSCLAYTAVPAANGCCMAFSGNVWRRIGGLNDALFESLIGAQKEWSLRAGLDGYRSLLAPGLYVAYHGKNVSAAEEDNGNHASARDILSVMFPSYEAHVKDFIREYPLSGSAVSIYLSLARHKGYRTEVFSEPSPFMARMSGDDGIFVLKAKSITKLAVRLLGETILVGNARNLERTGIFDA